MMPKSRRLPRELFASVLKSGRPFHSAHFSMRFLPNETTKIAVSVSKKVSKSAVARNTVRRRAYAAIRSVAAPLPHGLYLFVAKPGSGVFKGQKLSEELSSLINRI